MCKVEHKAWAPLSAVNQHKIFTNIITNIGLSSTGTLIETRKRERWIPKGRGSRVFLNIACMFYKYENRWRKIKISSACSLIYRKNKKYSLATDKGSKVCQCQIACFVNYKLFSHYLYLNTNICWLWHASGELGNPATWSWKNYLVLEKLPGPGKTTWSWKNYLVLEKLPGTGKTTWSWKNYLVLEKLPGPGKTTWSWKN